jgi:hypothetical protein
MNNNPTAYHTLFCVCVQFCAIGAKRLIARSFFAILRFYFLSGNALDIVVKTFFFFRIP